jgi:hypothetical protein
VPSVFCLLSSDFAMLSAPPNQINIPRITNRSSRGFARHSERLSRNLLNNCHSPLGGIQILICRLPAGACPPFVWRVFVAGMVD